LAAEGRDQAGKRNPASLSPAMADLCRVVAFAVPDGYSSIMQTAKSKPKRCNQPMKRTAPPRNASRVLVTTPRRGFSLSR
jgi:hypothetical protein